MLSAYARHTQRIKESQWSLVDDKDRRYWSPTSQLRASYRSRHGSQSHYYRQQCVRRHADIRNKRQPHGGTRQSWAVHVVNQFAFISNQPIVCIGAKIYAEYSQYTFSFIRSFFADSLDDVIICENGIILVLYMNSRALCCR